MVFRKYSSIASSMFLVAIAAAVYLVSFSQQRYELSFTTFLLAAATAVSFAVFVLSYVPISDELNAEQRRELVKSSKGFFMSALWLSGTVMVHFLYLLLLSTNMPLVGVLQ